MNLIEQEILGKFPYLWKEIAINGEKTVKSCFPIEYKIDGGILGFDQSRAHKTDLIIGTPQDLELSKTEDHLRLSDINGERVASWHRGLRHNIVYFPSRINNSSFWIIDDHKFLYPYLAISEAMGFCRLPTRLVHIDWHDDIGRLYDEVPFYGSDLPKLEFVKQTAEATQNLWDFNFVTALVASKMVKTVDHIGVIKADIIKRMMAESKISRQDGELNVYDAFHKSLQLRLSPRMLSSEYRIEIPGLFQEKPVVTSIDIDVLNIFWDLNRSKHKSGQHSMVSYAKKLGEKMKRVGFSPERMMTIIATSPGYNRFFDEEQEIIPAVQALVGELIR